MSKKNYSYPFFQKNAIALAVIYAAFPSAVWALNLAETPPSTVEPYIAPNLILSLDDSGSMGYQLNNSNAGTARTGPVNGAWPLDTQRISILKYTLKQVFNDHDLLPEKKIRFGWQALWNNGNTASNRFPGATNINTTGKHNLKSLDNTHRQNFIQYIDWLTANGGTPTHRMSQQAHKYMSDPLRADGPWASKDSIGNTKYLVCRRNYHILLSDGGWQTAPTATTKPGNDDGTSITLPDGTSYNKILPYADTHSDMVADWAFKSWATNLQPSLYDKDDPDKQIKPSVAYRKAPAQEDFGKDEKGNEAILQRYWNPRYDPANWPHMVTYTIGFSNAATTWSGEPNIKRPPNKIVPFSYDIGESGSLPDLITGNIKWPLLTASSEKTKNPLDLWHSALNGRGRYYAVEQADDLKKAFEDIIGAIQSENEPDYTANATSGSNTSRTDVGKFTAAYQPDNYWKGFIQGEEIVKYCDPASDTDCNPPTGDDAYTKDLWGGKTTADKMDEASFSVSGRLVLTSSDQWLTSGKEKGGVSFEWSSNQNNLSTTQKAAIGDSTTSPIATSGQRRLEYIRGDRNLEGTEPDQYTTAKPFRQRKSRQGDIINSIVWYSGAPSSGYTHAGYSSFVRNNKNRQPMLYVGGNDGMLHGFSVEDGSEKIAYVPKGAIPNLNLLTNSTYNNQHKAFVDGSPMTGDINIGSGTSDWRTVLVGTMGVGGRGYFVLDVSNPGYKTGGGATSAPNFAKANAADIVKIDRTFKTLRSCFTNTDGSILGGAAKSACTAAEEEDKDLGFITAQPVLDDNNPMRTTQITLMNNNRWAVVLGNGYNSINQRPVLLIQYLDGSDEKLLRIPVTSQAAGNGLANDNGLAAPRLVDLDGDGRPDIAYAGDNQGNLWKFDLTSNNDGDWGVAFGGTPLFTARGPSALSASARNEIQPITAAPTVRANDRTMEVGTGASKKTISIGGMQVAFGTGRNVDTSDPSNDKVQTIYSVLDNTRYKVITTALGKRLAVHPGGGTCTPIPAANCVPAPQALGTGVDVAKLAQQSISEIAGGDAGRVDIVQELEKETWINFNGWYLDLPAVGERLLKPMNFYDSSNILTIYSQVPARGSSNKTIDPNEETCEAVPVDEERQYRTFVNIMDGKKPSIQLVDYNGDGNYIGSSDQNVARKKVTKGSHTMITQGNKNMDIDVKNKKEELARMPEQSMRPSWRQMQ